MTPNASTVTASKPLNHPEHYEGSKAPEQASYNGDLRSKGSNDKLTDKMNFVARPLIVSTVTKLMAPTVTQLTSQNAHIKYLYRLALGISDMLMLVLAFALAYWLRFYGGLTIEPLFGPDPEHYARVLLIVIPLWLLLFALYQLYNFKLLLGGTKEYARAFSACTSGMMFVVLATFIKPEFYVARAWLVMFWVFAMFLVIGARFTWRRLVYRLRHQGHFIMPVIVVGTNSEAIALAEQLNDSMNSGTKVLGLITTKTNKKRNGLEYINDFPVLGSLGDLPTLVEEWGVQAVMTAITALSREQLLELYEKLAPYDVDLHLSSGLFEVLTTGVQVNIIGSVPFTNLNRVRLEPIEMAIKTLIDYTLVIVGIICLFPFLAIIALLIRLDSSGPIFYRRRVMGMGGKPFDAFKFRTMLVDGNEMLAREYPELLAELQANHKLKDDPRITRMGRILRRYSLDELPQLLNVLLGQMSLVGPRMISPEETKKYGRQHMNLLTVKPGLTGLWQVSGRSDLSYEERVHLDMHYICNYSIWTDLQILFVQTLPVVLKGRGAY